MKRKDTRKRVGDRHKPGYQRDYMRKYRAKQKVKSAAGGDKPQGE